MMSNLDFLADLNKLISAFFDLEKSEDGVYEILSKLCIKYTNADEVAVWTIAHDDYTLKTKTLSFYNGVVEDAFLYGLFAECLGGVDVLHFSEPMGGQVCQLDVGERQYPITHFLAIPVCDKEGETIAILNLLNKKQDGLGVAFNEEDIMFAKVFARMSGSFIGINHCANSLRTLLDFASKIAYSSSEESILALLNNMSRELLWADRSTMWVANEAKTKLWTQVAHGVESIEIPIDTGLAGHSFINKEDIICNDPYIDPRFNKKIDQETGYRTKNIAAIPLISSHNEAIGVLQCINKVPSANGFNQHDIVKLRLIGGYAANTLEVSRLNKEIEDAQQELLSIMGEAVEFRSKETGEHIIRVSKYSEQLAILYGIGEREAKILANAAPMHDIGKIAISENILNKPGKLTDEEFTIMKTHTNAGYSLLKKSDKKMITAAAFIAHEHHEKWDGSGYPQGLKGEDIHIYARIVAIADVFDALGNERCYKKAWPLKNILEFFAEQRGRHFDPVLTDLFLENINLFVADASI
jgi:HD-GYP domain-containing protein (c-di-GMP phosphodiesterase class II)